MFVKESQTSCVNGVMTPTMISGPTVRPERPRFVTREPPTPFVDIGFNVLDE